MAAHCPTGERKLAVNFAAKGNKEALRRLLEAGCDTEATDGIGWTPLMLAAFHGHTDCVQLLTQHGANVNKCVQGGLTASHFAAQEGDLEAVRMLFASGYVEVATSHRCLSVADYAASRSHVDVLSFAVACGCDLRAPPFFLVGKAVRAFYSVLLEL